MGTRGGRRGSGPRQWRGTAVLAAGTLGAGALGMVTIVSPAQAANVQLIVDSVGPLVQGGCADVATELNCTLADAIETHNADPGTYDFINFAPDIDFGAGTPGEIPVSTLLEITDLGLTIDGDVDADGDGDIHLVPALPDPETLQAAAVWNAIEVAADDVRLLNLEISGFEGPAVSIEPVNSGVTISKSAIHENNGNIVFNAEGGPEDPGSISNHDQLPPTVSTPTASGIQITTPGLNQSHLSVDAEPGYIVEVFRCDEDHEGKEFITSVSSIPAETTTLVELVASPGDRFSATVTDAGSHDTSTFSTCSSAVPATTPGETPGENPGETPPDGETPAQPSLPQGWYGPYGPYGPYGDFGPYGPYGPFGPFEPIESLPRLG